VAERKWPAVVRLVCEKVEDRAGPRPVTAITLDDIQRDHLL